MMLTRLFMTKTNTSFLSPKCLETVFMHISRTTSLKESDGHLKWCHIVAYIFRVSRLSWVQRSNIALRHILSSFLSRPQRRRLDLRASTVPLSDRPHPRNPTSHWGWTPCTQIMVTGYTLTLSVFQCHQKLNVVKTYIVIQFVDVDDCFVRSRRRTSNEELKSLQLQQHVVTLQHYLRPVRYRSLC